MVTINKAAILISTGVGVVTVRYGRQIYRYLSAPGALTRAWQWWSPGTTATHLVNLVDTAHSHASELEECAEDLNVLPTVSRINNPGPTTHESRRLLSLATRRVEAAEAHSAGATEPQRRGRIAGRTLPVPIAMPVACTTMVVYVPEDDTIVPDPIVYVSTEDEEYATLATVRTRRQGILTRTLIAEAKIEFGTPRVTAANHLSIRRFVAGRMKKCDVRTTDKLHVLNTVVAAVFIPSKDELELAAAFDEPLVQDTLYQYQSTSLGALRI